MAEGEGEGLQHEKNSMIRRKQEITEASNSRCSYEVVFFFFDNPKPRS
jgi:hypothetical protein